jgi:hypothetical protein
MNNAVRKAGSVLGLLVLGVLLGGHSGNRSRKFACHGKKMGVVSGIDYHRDRYVCQRKGAGRILETAGSTCNSISRCKVALHGCEIYAAGSLREIDR